MKYILIPILVFHITVYNALAALILIVISYIVNVIWQGKINPKFNVSMTGYTVKIFKNHLADAYYIIVDTSHRILHENTRG